ncbi:MAG: DUF1579 domain-containing protein [Candidatus Eisenbacteria bacterium]|nr:DUF1579 domain-containing protein [Candidatus Eisenbacteria bacterium]
MKFKKMLMVLMAVAMVAGTTLPARATDDKMAMDPDAMMKEWAKMNGPSDGHKIFDKYVGKWTATTKMWMDPAAPPSEEMGGMAEFSMMMGGRFLSQKFTSSMMGMPFEGFGTTGYDNFRKEYVSTWVDNISTATMMMNGGMKDAKTIEMTGLMDEPMTGEKDKKVRSSETWTDDNHFTWAMYDNIPGKGEVKVMEISYTRVK